MRTALVPALLTLAACAGPGVDAEVDRVVAGLAASGPGIRAALEEVPGHAVFPWVGEDADALASPGLLRVPGEPDRDCELVRPYDPRAQAAAVYHELVLLDAGSLATLLATGRLDLPAQSAVVTWEPDSHLAPGTPRDEPLRLTTPRGGLLNAPSFAEHAIVLTDD